MSTGKGNPPEHTGHDNEVNGKALPDSKDVSGGTTAKDSSASTLPSTRSILAT